MAGDTKGTFFKASMSRATQYLSYGINIVVIVTTALVAATLSVQTSLFFLLLPIPIVSIGLVTYMFRPLGYTLNVSSLDIVRPKGALSVPYTSIRQGTLIPKFFASDFRYAIRAFGSGGFFGYYGIFWVKKYGFFRAYLTRLSTIVDIECTDGKHIVVSPDDAEGFLNTLTSKIH